MKTLAEFQEYYNTTLLPELHALEEFRKRTLKTCRTVKRKIFWVFVSVFVGYAVAFRQGVLQLSGGWSFLFMVSFPVVPMGLLMTWGLIRERALRSVEKRYTKAFKDHVICKVAKFVHENLEYKKDSYVPRALFEVSQLFPARVYPYHGDDYFSGKIGNIEIEFSEVHYGAAKGGPHFHGLFFVADFHKRFTGTTVVVPAGRSLIGNRLQARFRKLQLVTLEDPEFADCFVVFSDDQIQARYILSTSFMERIGEFAGNTQRLVYLSFFASKVFVAIAYDRELFETKPSQPVVDFEPLQEYFEDLQLALSIVEDLNLNSRIWMTQETSPIAPGIVRIFEEYKVHLDDESVFFHPFIPEKRLKNALRSYAFGCSETETPLVLVDTTVLGSGKEGCLITDQSIYSNQTFEGHNHIRLSELRDVRFRSYLFIKIISANGKKILEFTNPQRKSLRLIAKMLQEMVSYSNEGKGL